MDLVIKNGHLVTHKDIFRSDIGIQAGKIAKITKHIPAAERSIDASGRLVFPGIIDPHTHMETSVKGVRSSDDFSTGTRAAEPVG